MLSCKSAFVDIFIFNFLKLYIPHTFVYLLSVKQNYFIYKIFYRGSVLLINANNSVHVYVTFLTLIVRHARKFPNAIVVLGRTIEAIYNITVQHKSISIP